MRVKNYKATQMGAESSSACLYTNAMSLKDANGETTPAS